MIGPTIVNLLLLVWSPCLAIREIPLTQGTVDKLILHANETVKLVSKEEHKASDVFWTFEAHTQDNDDHISLSRDYKETVDKRKIQVGNHKGLVVFPEENVTKSTAFLKNERLDRSIDLIILFRGYPKEYPIPGGYTNQSSTSNSLRLSYDTDTIHLEIDESSTIDWEKMAEDEEAVLTYNVYQHYLAERNLDQQSFLSHLSSTMLNLDDIISNGLLVNDDFILTNDTKKRVSFAAYPGTAVIFSVVVTSSTVDSNGSTHHYSSLYVTTSTYACQLEGSDPLNCNIMWYTITKIICGISVFVGAFIAFFGHRSFQTSQFIFGSYGIGLVTYVIIAVLNNGQLANYSQQAGLALAVGIIGGVSAVTLWCFLGIPILSAALPVALSGLLLGSCVVFLPAVNNITMSNDTFYWLLITAFIIGALLIILPFTKTASILSCALIGTFIFFVSIDHYVGTSLKFILVNFLRRAYVENFNYAVLNFPFQTNDIAMVCGWLALILVSFLVQCVREKGRAPFPPNPYQIRRWRNEEQASLAENAINAAAEGEDEVGDERQPLLTGRPQQLQRNRPMSPTSRSPRQQQVVGYIEPPSNSNANNAGDASYGSLSLRRSLESPTLYNAQPRGRVPSPKRFWQNQQDEPVQSSSAEARDPFRPPGHLSQN